MKILLIVISIICLASGAFGQKGDTVSIQKKDLDLKFVRLGNSKYVVYAKKELTGPAIGIMLVNINVE